MKFSGIIGFWIGDEETRPGIYEPKIVEKPYVGDILRNNRRFQDSGHQNDNLTITNQISILSDLFMNQNFHSIRYVLWNGVKWKVTTVNIEYPRITMDIGGVYNGKD